MLADYLSKHSPVRPYCTDDLRYGLQVCNRQTALKKRYMQVNNPAYCHTLIFDIDRAGAAYAAQDADLPDPSAIIITPKNRHAHLWYSFYTPVATGDAAKQHPLRYLAAIQRTLGRILGADMAYSGLITKNPLCGEWLSLYPLNAPVRRYTMQQLHEDIGLLDQKRQEKHEVTGLGRNCMLFDKLRVWAYEAVRRHRGDTRRDSFAIWQTECISKAESFNADFLSALSFSEVRTIAQSIAKFCWKHDPEHETKFMQRQSARGRTGGINSGKARLAQNEDKRASARLMRAQGMSTRQIGDELGVGKSTIARWLCEL